ncbi:Hsp70 family protein [Plantactinospora sp. B24E8]|uniref:Hsp70 family protein n=1 Tax=Plantactinospora sp. B24E8 TaxID=3153567 RepID=UPI00325E3D9F
MRLLAIDFGTSNTVAAVRGGDGRPRPLLFDGTPLLPSGVCLDRTGAPLTGRDAERAARLDPARYEPHPKRRIDDGTVLLGDREVAVVALVAAVLRRVAVEAGRQLGGVDEVRLTHPAGWGERRRSVLVAAAGDAGLPTPTLLAEPVAAAAYYVTALGAALPPGRALAVYDLGGGTLDLTVVRRTPDGFEVLAEAGDAQFGGLDVDQALVEQLGRAHAGDRTGLWRGLLTPADVEGRRRRSLLYDEARAAKELLSRAASAELHLPGLDVRAHVTREELESLAEPLLAPTVDGLARVVRGAGLAPRELDGIFLVGGSSRIPLVARLIHARLGVAPTALEQPETVVAEGALADPPPSTVTTTSTLSSGSTVPAGSRPSTGTGTVVSSGTGTPSGVVTAPVFTTAAGTAPAGRFWHGASGARWTGVLATLVVVALVVLVAVAGAD